MEIILRYLWVLYYEEPSLKGGWVCNLQLLMYLARAVISGLSPAGLTNIFYTLNSETPQIRGSGSCIYFPRNKTAQQYSRHRITADLTTHKVLLI